VSEVALKRICTLVTDPGPNEKRPFVALEHVVSGRGSLQEVVELPRRRPTAGLVAVSPGDVLFGKLRPYLAKTFRVSEPMFASTELMALRPTPNVDSRWLHYLVMSDQILGWAVATSDGSKMPRTNWSALGEYRTSVPEPSLQREIADFLDSETARIDALIAKKRQMIDILEERRTRVLEELFADAGLILPMTVDPAALDSVARPADWRIIRLSHVLRQLTNGYVGPTRDILQPSGVPYIQSLHIKRGRIDFDRRPYYVSPEWHAARPRIALRPNDVVIVQTGDVGQVALVPGSIGEASCHALLIARVKQDVISGPYLAAYLQSYLGYHSLLRMATGALHPHLESSIKEVRIIVPPTEVQVKLVWEIERRQALLDQTTDRLGQQIKLLVEHRQALITAAVTGQLEIPGAAA
jgi:type I restriction enzyme S subunit